MRIIWTKGSAPTRDVISLMQRKRDWSESTIKTLLSRLVTKGFLTTERDNRKFIYHPAIAETSAMDDAAGQLFDHLCSMKKGKALINLVENQAMSSADIETMIGVLQSKLTTAPDHLTCDCLPADISGTDGSDGSGGSGSLSGSSNSDSSGSDTREATCENCAE
jgi:CopY/TcrY family copper transport repressor